MDEITRSSFMVVGLGELPFIKRVKIVVGVARGLHFLEQKKLIIEDWILDTDEIWLDKVS